jgi:hypothetical protein
MVNQRETAQKLGFVALIENVSMWFEMSEMAGAHRLELWAYGFGDSSCQ